MWSSLILCNRLRWEVWRKTTGPRDAVGGRWVQHCVCWRCGRSPGVSRWAAVWLSTARWRRYKRDLSSGPNSHVFSLDLTPALPRLKKKIWRSQRAAESLWWLRCISPPHSPIWWKSSLSSLGTGKRQQVVVNVPPWREPTCTDHG